MLPKTYKEARMASIEVLFNFFKAVPSTYYNETEKELSDGSTQIKKAETQTIKKELDKKLTGFDYIEISGIYLSAFDQKVFRAIIQCVNKQEEQSYSSNLVNAKSLNEEYIPVKKEIYSNKAVIDINEFYKIFNPNAKHRASTELYKKIVKSLDRLAHVILSFYTKDKRNIITAPLLIFSRIDNQLFLQLHPAILSFQYESKNENILKLKQSYYSLNNNEYYTLENDLQRLLYSKIQYKFASMGSSNKQCSFEFENLKSQLFLPVKFSKNRYKQNSKLRKAISELNSNKNCSYDLKIEGSKILYLIVCKS